MYISVHKIKLKLCYIKEKQFSFCENDAWCYSYGAMRLHDKNEKNGVIIDILLKVLLHAVSSILVQGTSMLHVLPVIVTDERMFSILHEIYAHGFVLICVLFLYYERLVVVCDPLNRILQGLCLLGTHRLIGMGFPFWNHLRFMMGILILVRRRILVNRCPGLLHKDWGYRMIVPALL